MAKIHIHRIVILGGSFAGMGVAHRLLKALSVLSQKNNHHYKVTIVSENTHFWWTIGAPRAMTKAYPSAISDSFIPIMPGFRNYSSDMFHHLHGQVLSVDVLNKTVKLTAHHNSDSPDSQPEYEEYDTLVVATGATGPSPLFSYHGGHEKTEQAYQSLHNSLPNARDIVIVGGGPAGVETAAELADKYGILSSEPKNITLYTGSERALPNISAAHGNAASSHLRSIGVRVVDQVRLTESEATDDGRVKAIFDDGSTTTADILLQATGRKPNASFLPRHLLNDRGAVKVDSKMRSEVDSSVFAVGDVASSSDGGMMHIYFAVPITAMNILAQLDDPTSKEKDFKQSVKETQLVSLGNSGVGSLFGWTVPGWIVWLLKSRNMMFPMAKKHVTGSAI